MKILFPLFAIATLIEIYTIIQVGEVIGGFNTILLIILTAFAGSFLVKHQGIATLTSAQHKINSGEIPANEMLSGVVIFIAGILLLTPGFITDIIGLLGLIPQVRNKIIARLGSSKNTFSFQTTHFKSQQKNSIDSETIEGEFWKND